MKKITLRQLRVLILTALFLFFFGCEPVSVSVNSHGDIAFTRAEGVFFYDAKSGRVATVNWNYGAAAIPVIVRWSPDDEILAYSAKASKDDQTTAVYVVQKSGGTAKKVYSTQKIITQMEWAPDGKYLSLAQQGADTDLGVADLVLISAIDGMSKIIVENCGDVHNWLDEKTIALIKISGKNGESSDVLNGKLATWTVGGADIQATLDVKVTKTGGLDASPRSKMMAFTALQVGPESQEYIPSQIDKIQYDNEVAPKFFGDDQKDLFAGAYSMQKGSYRLKGNLSKDDKDKLHDLLSNVGFLNSDKPYCYVLKAGENKAEKLGEVSINFLQFSPDGNNLLVKAKPESGVELGIINLGAKSYKSLVANIADTVSANSGSVQVYPSWAGPGLVVYFMENPVYGSNGIALTLMSIDTASLKKHNLQVGIDSDVAKLVETKGGY